MSGLYLIGSNKYLFNSVIKTRSSTLKEKFPMEDYIFKKILYLGGINANKINMD